MKTIFDHEIMSKILFSIVYQFYSIYFIYNSSFLLVNVRKTKYHTMNRSTSEFGILDFIFL